jgi:hypothetical protein
MKTAINSLPHTVREMLSSCGEDFYAWQAESVESGGYARQGSSNRDRFNRCYEAAKDGGDVSTHGENIDDFRAFGRELFSEARRMLGRFDMSEAEESKREEEIDSSEAAYEADCDATEAWHEANGSLDQEVG